MNVLALFKPITTLVFDMDGVLTDGSLLLTEDGAWLRSMHTRDGFALQLAVKQRVEVIVITGSSSEPVVKRLNKLGITKVYQQVKDKASFLRKYISDHKLKTEEILFMGDDIPDLGAMKLSGLPCCPSDAVTEVKAISQYISPFTGGKGCVRDVIEKVLKLNDRWELESNIAST